jgi:SAM-dependent methyltransferase
MAGEDWMNAALERPEPPIAHLDTGVPHSARIYDYLLGGKDNFTVDRVAAEGDAAANPGVKITARANREWLRRVVGYLTAEAGIRQFLDLGTGIPTSPNVHEIAQAIAPETRVVYVDNDPMVLAHARALLTGGTTDYVDGDFRHPERILAEAGRTLDFSRPIGLLLVGLGHLIADEDQPHRIVAQLLDALPPGSYLALSHLTGDLLPEQWRRIEEKFAARGGVMRVRSRMQIGQFFDGLAFVDPGLVLVHRWRPGPTDRYGDSADELISIYGGVARKP